MEMLISSDGVGIASRREALLFSVDRLLALSEENCLLDSPVAYLIKLLKDVRKFEEMVQDEALANVAKCFNEEMSLRLLEILEAETAKKAIA